MSLWSVYFSIYFIITQFLLFRCLYLNSVTWFQLSDEKVAVSHNSCHFIIIKEYGRERQCACADVHRTSGGFVCITRFEGNGDAHVQTCTEHSGGFVCITKFISNGESSFLILQGFLLLGRYLQQLYGLTRQQGLSQYLPVVERFRKKQDSKVFGYLVCSRDCNFQQRNITEL